MADKTSTAEQVMASLFAGVSNPEQMRIMSRLERGGGAMYRAWAAAELNVKAREALIAAADREDQNAKLLSLMTTPKLACEKCAKELAMDVSAFRCSFQCTFCPDCADALRHVCPNCGGPLTDRSTACAR